MFTAMINMPGYLPDTDGELQEFETQKECVDYLFEELEHNFDDRLEACETNIEHGKTMSLYEHAMESLQKHGSCNFNGLYYGAEEKEAA